MKAHTYMELLVAMVVISLFVGFIGPSFSNWGRSQELLNTRLQSQQEYRTILRILEGLRGRVLVPYWASPEQSINVSNNGFSLGYLDGEAEKILQVSYNGSALIIHEPESYIELGSWSQVEFSEILNDQESLVGVEIILIQDGTEYTTAFLPGSRSL